MLSETNTMLRFQYEPLPAGNSERVSIRLLQLLPGSAEEPIKCSIIVVNLYDDPAYEALSYYWGDTASSIPIQSGEELINVTSNLHDALVNLRLKDKLRVLWVDAVCINQADLLERSQQVGIMKQIYIQSRKTLIWLGPENEDTAKAFELIPYLLAAYNQAFGANPCPIRHHPAVVGHPSILEVYKRLNFFEPFLQLEHRPYFSRIWIIQELAVSFRKAEIRCGSYHAAWEEYFAAAYTFACLQIQKPRIHKPLGAFLELVVPALQLAASDAVTLISLLDRYRHQDSTDPRDKVFSLLGIASARDVTSLGCTVDYHSTVIDVYTNLARAYIRRDNNLDILGYVQHSTDATGLPSWVPDWTNHGGLAINFRKPCPSGAVRSHRAGGDDGCAASTSADGKSLNSKGMIFDRIQTISGLIDSKWEGGCCNVHICESLFKLKERGIYVAGGTAMDAFFITQLAGCPKSVYEKVKTKLHEFWDQGRKHTMMNAYHGSVTVTSIKGVQQRRVRLTQIDDSQSSDAEALLMANLQFTARRRFVATSKGYYGLVPAQAAVGDQVAILKGGNYPFVLRSCGRNWKLVGECYVHGVMNGELCSSSAYADLTIV
ncbi:heterokaryon incompatibility protein-domain-containing protein [Stachybotrys elegans]|uniref:Heterokaryon incompatibility protein-domain-containing protein n=1 Tax=Stachybotrys elegans TaxID=80388 RepID=A0A8K0WM83_9HYPO|nr:heterokaryon incompatibility protein-domain-containing protein [Stachybotrys elegans]